MSLLKRATLLTLLTLSTSKVTGFVIEKTGNFGQPYFAPTYQTLSKSKNQLYVDPPKISLSRASAWKGAAEASINDRTSTVLDINEIKQILPHRYPFLLVDRILECEIGKRIVGIKQITANEEFFNGHFPDRPIMPGVLQIEALAQLGGILALKSLGNSANQIFFFAGLDTVKWRKPVTPGDTLVMETELLTWHPNLKMVKMNGKSYVDGKLVNQVSGMNFILSQ